MQRNTALSGLGRPALSKRASAIEFPWIGSSIGSWFGKRVGPWTGRRLPLVVAMLVLSTALSATAVVVIGEGRWWSTSAAEPEMWPHKAAERLAESVQAIADITYRAIRQGDLATARLAIVTQGKALRALIIGIDSSQSVRQSLTLDILRGADLVLAEADAMLDAAGTAEVEDRGGALLRSIADLRQLVEAMALADHAQMAAGFRDREAIQTSVGLVFVGLMVSLLFALRMISGDLVNRGHDPALQIPASPFLGHNSGRHLRLALLHDLNRVHSEIHRTVARAACEADRADTLARSVATTTHQVDAMIDLIASVASQANQFVQDTAIQAVETSRGQNGAAAEALRQVRSLATTTASATEEVRSRIATLQAQTGGAVEAMDAVLRAIDGVHQIAGLHPAVGTGASPSLSRAWEPCPAVDVA